jgi:hypothetical protein
MQDTLSRAVQFHHQGRLVEAALQVTSPGMK